MPFLYLYVIASRLGEEAAILEGILLERFEAPPLPHPRATPRSGGVSPTGPGPPPWGTPEWVGFPAAASTGHGRSCFEAAYSRTPGASPPAPAGPSAPPP